MEGVLTFHCFIGPVYPKIPYAIIAPTILAEALPANQNECLETCSWGVYHIPVISEKPGLMALSKTPSKKRRTMRLAKLFATECSVRITPQMNMSTLRYLPRGNLTKPRDIGYEATR